MLAADVAESQNARDDERNVSFQTLGCKTNQLESSALAAQFRARGWRIVPFDEPAHVAVINTCTVTERADADSRRAIRRARLSNPDARVVVTGCYAQIAPEAVSRLPGVDYVIGNNFKEELLAILDAFPRGDADAQAPLVRVSDVDKSRIMAGAEACDVDRTRASLKIQDGCDFKCTYCVIWQARGRSRSLSADDALAQAQALAERGYREIVLTGINIGQYDDPASGGDLADLLTRLSPPLVQRGDAPVRLRLTSLDPVEATDALLAVVARSAGGVCPHLHLSAQSLCDRTLKAMGRRHRAADVARVCGALSALLPDAGLGMDLIVGFPGEDDAAFEETFALAQALPLTYLHVFRYSRRPGTPAADWPDQVSEPIKAQRAHRLRALAQDKRRAFIERLATSGRALPTLMEDSGRSGLADNYLKLTLTPHTPEQAPNTLVQARVVGLDEAEGVVWATLDS